MFKIFNLCFLLLILNLNYVRTATLPTVNDDELVQLIRESKSLIILFSKAGCESCLHYEQILLILKDDLKDNLNAETLSAHNSQLARLYSPLKEPALVFFRHGVPLLYDGPISEAEIYDNFNANRDPVVKELADSNFEHLTQASSGATTGDWLIMFYTAECIECQRLGAIWEAVGAALKTRMNVARINSHTVGINTGKRFKIEKAPEFILLRQGKYYRYEFKNYAVKSFVAFAHTIYKNVVAEKVQHPASPFELLVEWAVIQLKNMPNFIDFGLEIVYAHPYIFVFIVSGFVFTFAVSILTLLKTTKNSSKSGTKKQK